MPRARPISCGCKAEHFAACPSDSIDYAVMEKTDAARSALDAGWNDVGSWAALWEATAQDAEGNAHHGDVIALNCRNTYAHASRLVAMIGLDDVVVVDTDDALLIAHIAIRCSRSRTWSARSRAVGARMRSLHRKVYRPWGAYDSIDNGERFQVKRITVKPGGALSLQMHHHRAEHWIVVSGTAKVTRGDETILLAENQSTYIPLGVVHRLENPGRLPLELIEVQSGAYLGEDDIVRFEDVYGSAQRGQPLVVRAFVDALEQRRGEVALAGIRQHRQQHASLARRRGRSQRCGQRGAGGDADEDAFLAASRRAVSRWRSIVGPRSAAGNIAVEHFGHEVGCPALDLVRLPFLPGQQRGAGRFGGDDLRTSGRATRSTSPTPVRVPPVPQPVTK
jgi:mannose-6-phosphate isomerase-like protein (cupin superfamily)